MAEEIPGANWQTLVRQSSPRHCARRGCGRYAFSCAFSSYPRTRSRNDHRVLPRQRWRLRLRQNASRDRTRYFFGMKRHSSSTHSITASMPRMRVRPGPASRPEPWRSRTSLWRMLSRSAIRTLTEGLYVRGGRGPQGEPAEVFVGAAAARILNHIYTTPAHTQLIATRRQQFLRTYNSDMLSAWNAGLEFGRSEQFTSRWNWRSLKDAALSSYKQVQGAYRGRHDVDPFNTDQKFYGANWSNVAPLLPGLPIRSAWDLAILRANMTATMHGISRRSARLEHGAPDGPTAEQVKIGLYLGL